MSRKRPRSPNRSSAKVRPIFYCEPDEKPAGRRPLCRLPKTVLLASIADPRLTDLVRLDGGEGWGTFTAAFDGRPAFVIDGRILNKFAREGERLTRPIIVRVFDDWESRNWYVEHRRRRHEELHQQRPGAIVLPFVRR